MEAGELMRVANRGCPDGCPDSRGSFGGRSPHESSHFRVLGSGAFKTFEWVRARAPRAAIEGDVLDPRALQGGRDVAHVRVNRIATGGAWAGRPRLSTYAKREYLDPQGRVDQRRAHLDMVEDRPPCAFSFGRGCLARPALQHRRAPSPHEETKALEGEDSAGLGTVGRLRPGGLRGLELCVEAFGEDDQEIEAPSSNALPEASGIAPRTNRGMSRPGGRGAPGPVDRPCTLLWLTALHASSAPPRSPLFGAPRGARRERTET
jgi:hypothetical protein